MIHDVSSKGCRLNGRLNFPPGASGKVLIDVPSFSAPLRVAISVVRWVKGSECGLEFMAIEPHDQSMLQRIIETAKNVQGTNPKDVEAH
jgi:hypothetical protein